MAIFINLDSVIITLDELESTVNLRMQFQVSSFCSLIYLSSDMADMTAFWGILKINHNTYGEHGVFYYRLLLWLQAVLISRMQKSMMYHVGCLL